jgi:thioredoxin 1
LVVVSLLLDCLFYYNAVKINYKYFLVIVLNRYGMKDYGLGEMEDIANNSNSLVLFYADWCHYCSRFLPIFEESLKKINPKVLVGGVKLNDDDNPLWDKYNINAVPTLIAFSNNSIKSRRDAKMGVGLTNSDLNSILSDMDIDANENT